MKLHKYHASLDFAIIVIVSRDDGNRDFVQNDWLYQIFIKLIDIEFFTGANMFTEQNEQKRH